MMNKAGVIKDSLCNVHTPVIWGKPEKKIYGKGVSILPVTPGKRSTKYEQSVYLEKLLPLEDYNLIIVLYSGGKDSTASLLRLLEIGVPKEKIEIWHHDIDGGGQPARRMDWPVTPAYVRAFSEAMEIKLRTSWRVGGFFGELYRVGASLPIEYEDGAEVKTCRLSPAQIRSEELREKILLGLNAGDELAKFGYRMKFPAKSGDLARRWCSAYLKIIVADTVIRNMDELQSIGHVDKFPAKSSIGFGRWCSPVLKREVADSVVRNLTELAGLGSLRHKFPAKASPQQGRYCSGALKASVQDGVTSNLESARKDIKILIISGERRGGFLTSCTLYQFTRLKLFYFTFGKRGVGRRPFRKRFSPHIEDSHATTVNKNRRDSLNVEAIPFLYRYTLGIRLFAPIFARFIN